MDIGKYNILKISEIERDQAWLQFGEDEIGIPRLELPQDIHEGDRVKVFVYNLDKDTLAATTQKPNALVDEFAYMRVKGLLETGALLDWGIEKDLYLPKGSMIRPVEKGDWVLVRLVLNYDKNGIIADGDWERYTRECDLQEGDQVSLTIMGDHELGTRVLVENQYIGLVYRSEGYRPPQRGEKRTGYILKIREDGKLDVSFKRKGWDSVLDSRDTVLKALEEAGGFLPLHDKSDPEEIREQLNMSKKVFKKVVGTLYKEKVINIKEEGIELLS